MHEYGLVQCIYIYIVYAWIREDVEYNTQASIYTPGSVACPIVIHNSLYYIKVMRYSIIYIHIMHAYGLVQCIYIVCLEKGGC